MNFRRLALPAVLLASGCASNISERDRTDIYLVLERQRMAWNDGSLVDYMDGYAKSDALVMAGGGEFRRGWQDAFDRYRARYSPETMGRLSFSDLEIQSMGPDSALVLGRWRLEWPERKATEGGVFSLAFRRFENRWRIVHDHTSSEAGS